MLVRILASKTCKRKSWGFPAQREKDFIIIPGSFNFVILLAMYLATSVSMRMSDNQRRLYSFAGHGMIVEGHPDLEQWGRRLMAVVPDNETEQKNCSEPGMLF